MISFSEAFGRNLLSISDGRGRGHNHTGCDDSKNFLTRTDVNPFQAMDRMVLNMQNSIYAKKKKITFRWIQIDIHLVLSQL